MTASSTGHVRKRQYQPSITSYFDSSGQSVSAANARSPLSPPLPEEVQSNLISVGMRVRKSVPEGYKTHKTLASSLIPPPSTAPSRPSAGLPIASSQGSERSRELMPFCGLHKTGGWASQPEPYVPSSSAPPALGRQDADDDTPGLTESQGTAVSTQDTFAWGSAAHDKHRRKRTYEEEEDVHADSYNEQVEADMDALFEEMDATEVTSLSQRRIAKPKATLRKVATIGMFPDIGGDDFEDAAFLAPPMDVD